MRRSSLPKPAPHKLDEKQNATDPAGSYCHRERLGIWEAPARHLSPKLDKLKANSLKSQTAMMNLCTTGHPAGYLEEHSVGAKP